MIIKPEQAKTVGIIFDWYLDGNGLSRIKDGFDWYLRFDGSPKNLFHCSDSGKRKSTLAISVAGENSPDVHMGDTGSYQGWQEIRTRPANEIKDFEQVPRNLVADAIRYQHFASFTLTLKDAQNYLY